jgi:hypothetical protein
MATSSSCSEAYNGLFPHMAVLDSWPQQWRELAYEYGYVIVAAMYGEGSYEAVKADLEIWRERLQADHLMRAGRGDYAIPKSAFFVGLGGFKTATEKGLPKPKPKFII